jgi:hypothetical protein
MRLFQSLTTIFGSLAVALTLALLSPGVDVVRADDAAVADAAAAEGPTCEASAVNDGHVIVDRLQHIQRLQIERMAASAVASDTPGDFVVLNNRGYNYGPAGVADPGAVGRESR